MFEALKRLIIREEGLMKNKCTVIQISGLRGILIAGFVVACIVAGFVVFPGWCCKQMWNYIAGFVAGMPVMELKHGLILWIIIALVSYVTMFGKFKVSFIEAKDEQDLTPDKLKDMELIQSIKKEIAEEIEKKEIEEIKK